MKMILAIDWMNEFSTRFTFVKMDSGGLKDAMLEAVAKAARVSMETMEIRKKRDVHPMANVYCLKLLQVGDRNRKASDTGWRFSAYQCRWHLEEEKAGDPWPFVDPRCAMEVKLP